MADPAENTFEKPQLITIHSTRKSKKMLRRVAAITDEKQYEVLDRLLEDEMKRLNIQLNVVEP